MNHPQSHPHVYSQVLASLSNWLEALSTWLVVALYKMPLAQGVIVFMAFSILLGTLTRSNIEIIATVTQGIAFFTVMLVGSLTLWLLQHDRRKQRHVLEVAVMLLMITNVMYLLDLSPLAKNFLYDVMSVVLACALFLAVAHGFYETHPELQDYDHEKES